MSKKIVTDKSKSTSKSASTKKNKKESLSLLVGIIAVVVVIIVLVVFAVNSKNKTEKKDSSNQVSLGKDRDYTEFRERYSGGLDKEGNIVAVENIDDYVKLCDIDSIVLYTKDFPANTDKKKREAGKHILEEIVANSTVTKNQEYYDKLVELYHFMYNDYFEQYSEAVDTITEEEIWQNKYAFLGVSEKVYDRMVNENANNDMEHFLVVQALYEKLNLSVTDDDIKAFCFENDHKALNKNDISLTYNKFGDGYVMQRTKEYVIENYLAVNTKTVDASITDQWTSHSDIYGAGLYPNGYIDGVSDISEYVQLPDMKNYDYNVEFDEYFDYLLANSKFKAVPKYSEKVKAILEYESSDASDKAVEEFVNRKLLVQYLYTEYEKITEGEDKKIAFLTFENYHDMYNATMGYEDRMKESFECGVPYVSQKVMEFAVKHYTECAVIK